MLTPKQAHRSRRRQTMIAIGLVSTLAILLAAWGAQAERCEGCHSSGTAGNTHSTDWQLQHMNQMSGCGAGNSCMWGFDTMTDNNGITHYSDGGNNDHGPSSSGGLGSTGPKAGNGGQAANAGF